MSKLTSRVGLARRADRRANCYGALDLVRADITAKVADQVLLKPNFLSSQNQLASTHLDAIRGTIDFLLSTPTPPREIIIAEGANEKYSGESFDNFGYRALHDEYDVPIRLVDLHQETDWVETPIITADYSERTVRMPKLVLDCPCTISVAVAKTHDVCVVTLAQKNMIMGTLHKKDRIWMHGFPSHPDRILPDEAQVLNINLIRLARFLQADIGVVDGTVGLQGDGPGGTDAVPLGVAAASGDVFACDAVSAAAMGFEPMELGLLNYADSLGIGVGDLGRIEVLETAIEEVRTSFKPHQTTDQQLQWHQKRAAEYLQVS
ncbi:MAG: DUF362 domain-containing protein [Candidatus Latescibacteria bacterium]|nr:DUF362 domain-containing protein [Candidatus Latescibacterota bacterium]